MGANRKPIFPGGVRNEKLIIADTDGTTVKDFITGGANGSLILSVSIASDDSASRDIIAYFNDGVDDSPLGRLTVSAGAGTNGTAQSQSLLNAVNMPYLKDDLTYPLESGNLLRIGAVATLTTGKKIHLVACVGDY